MKYYLKRKSSYLSNAFFYYRESPFFSPKPTAFDTIEAAKSKGQELGGTFEIVNERFEVVWKNGL